MVQFLAHAENGKYQSAFAEFIRQIGLHRSWKDAWKQTFGDINGFEDKWKLYWMTLPDQPTQTLYAQAAVSAMTSFLARASAEGQTFEAFGPFAQAGRRRLLKMRADESLPPKYFDEMLEMGLSMGTFTLEGGRGKGPSIRLQMQSGVRLVGTFSLKDNRRVDKVMTEIVGEKPVPLRRAPQF